MSNHMDDELPGHLADVAASLRAHGPSVDPAQLDDIKQVAMTRASRDQRRGRGLRSKVVTLSLAAALALTGGSAAVIAATGSGGTTPTATSGSAAKGEYGKPCKRTKIRDCR